MQAVQRVYHCMERQQRPVQCRAYVPPISSLPPVTQPPQAPPKLPASSADLTADLLATLREQVPHVFSESGIDFDKLKATLGGAAAEGKERYGLTWAGKMDAFRNVQSVSNGTLAPMQHESVNWDATGHLIIEGDNLEVLKLLQRPYHGKVKMIYIDPPYNTGNEFIYPDNFREGLQDYLRYSGQVSIDGFAQSANKDSNGRYHSNWLNMLYPRLFLARNLLREDGVIFVSIDDHEVHNLRHLMDEVFGEENFVAQLIVQSNPKGRVLDRHFSKTHEYMLAYSKGDMEYDLALPRDEVNIAQTYPESDDGGEFRVGELRNTHRQFGKHNRRLMAFPLYVDPISGCVSDVEAAGLYKVLPNWDDGFEGCWTWGLKKVKTHAHLLFGRQVNGKWKIYRRTYARDESGQISRMKLKSIFLDAAFNTEKGQAAFDKLMPPRMFEAPKPPELLATFVALLDDPHALILDFFAGSGTTAQAVLELNAKDGGNRKFILVQLPEKTGIPKFPVIADITRERVRRVIAKLESAAKEKADAERQSSMALGASAPVANGEADFGFRAFRLAASNFRVWDAGNASDANALAQQIALHADNLNGAASSGALVYELILRAGLPPSARVERVGIAADGAAAGAAREAFAVDGDALLVCVESAVTPGLMRALIARKPKKLVCLDKAFADDDAAKTNALLEATSHDVMFYTA